MKTSSVKRKDQAFGLRVRLIAKVEFPLSFELVFMNDNIQKTYLPSALKHLSGCHFKILSKKRNVIVTFQSGQLTEQPKNTGWPRLLRFENVPQLSYQNRNNYRQPYIFKLFLPRVVILCLHFTPRGKIFGIKCQPCSH